MWAGEGTFAAKPSRILVLADDLTGALEAGAKFAERGLKASVRFAAPFDDSPVTVVDTESRHLAPVEAEQRIRDVIGWGGWDLIYKKTDSTLRGNLASEMRALGGSVLFWPAYPTMGRTVKDGQLFVDGELLHQTPFAFDPLNPIISSVVADALYGCGSHVRVCDAQTECSIAEGIAEALSGTSRPIFAGPANVAGHLANLLAPDSHPPNLPRPLGKCLVVNGSLHPASAAQFEYGRVRNWAGWVFSNAWIEGVYDTLIVFGGDTAFQLTRLLGIAQLTPIGELIPGVPVSNAGAWQVITKAGGFGPVDVLGRVRNMLAS